MLALPAALLLAQIPLPGTTSVSVALSPPNACGRCHGIFDPSSAYETWVGSVMGHAARDPVFLAATTIAEQDYPGVGDLCLRCHAPEAWLQGRCFPSDGSAIRANDSGVTCSACHRMLPNPYVRNGQYIVADNSIMRGPYRVSHATHQNTYEAWISDSKLCGTCHNLINPLVERRALDGTRMGVGFPEQTTYLEWEASAFSQPGGKGCKDCHMPEDMGPVAANEMDRPDRSSHGTAGANTFLLDAIDFLYPDLGISQQLAVGRARIRAVLRTAAKLELVGTVPQASRGEAIRLHFRVTNESGHKLPSGYPEGRQMYVTARSSTLGIDRGNALDPVHGEPIDPVVKYEAIQGIHGQGPSHHLALVDTIFSDNRIPPRGFVPTATTAPVGKVYPEVSPGVLQHWDDFTLTATIPCSPALDRVSGDLELRYLVLPRRYVDQLVAANPSGDRGQKLRDAYDAVPSQPELLASVHFEVAIDPASSCPAPDAGFPDQGFIDAGFLEDAGFLPDAPGAADATLVDAGSTVDAGSNEVAGGCNCTTAVRPSADGGLILGVVLSALWAGRWRSRRERESKGART